MIWCVKFINEVRKGIIEFNNVGAVALLFILFKFTYPAKNLRKVLVLFNVGKCVYLNLSIFRCFIYLVLLLVQHSSITSQKLLNIHTYDFSRYYKDPYFLYNFSQFISYSSSQKILNLQLKLYFQYHAANMSEPQPNINEAPPTGIIFVRVECFLSVTAV